MNDKKEKQSQEVSRRPNLVSAPRTQEDAETGISRRGFLGFAAATIFKKRNHVSLSVRR